MNLPRAGIWQHVGSFSGCHGGWENAQHLEPEAGMLRSCCVCSMLSPAPTGLHPPGAFKDWLWSSEPSKHSSDLFDSESRKRRAVGHGRTEQFI